MKIFETGFKAARFRVRVARFRVRVDHFVKISVTRIRIEESGIYFLN